RSFSLVYPACRLPLSASLRFPSTALFRSLVCEYRQVAVRGLHALGHQHASGYAVPAVTTPLARDEHLAHVAVVLHAITDQLAERSEEHTSELQSRENLVCRLLLEKKTSQD